MSDYNFIICRSQINILPSRKSVYKYSAECQKVFTPNFNQDIRYFNSPLVNMWYNQVAVYSFFVKSNTSFTQNNDKIFLNSIPQKALTRKSFRQLLGRIHPQRIAVT